MNWINPGELPRPNRNDFPTTGDFMLADNVWVSLQNPTSYFIAATPAPEYANPQAYITAMEAYAHSFFDHNFPVPYVPPGWDAKGAADSACADCFNKLVQIPVNSGDPQTWSVFMAWVMGTGQLYGGHPAAPSGANQNASAGQEAAPPGSIL